MVRRKERIRKKRRPDGLAVALATAPPESLFPEAVDELPNEPNQYPWSIHYSLDGTSNWMKTTHISYEWKLPTFCMNESNAPLIRDSYLITAKITLRSIKTISNSEMNLWTKIYKQRSTIRRWVLLCYLFAVCLYFGRVREVEHAADILRADALVGVLQAICDVFTNCGQQLVDEELIAFGRYFALRQVDLKVFKKMKGYW